MKLVVLLLFVLTVVGCGVSRGEREGEIRKNLGGDVTISKLDYRNVACFFAQKPNGEVWVCDFTVGGVGTYKMFPAVK